MGHKLKIRLIIIFALLTLSCQAFDDLNFTISQTAPADEPDEWPLSAFTQIALLSDENVPILPFNVQNVRNAVTIAPAGPTDLPPGLLLPQETVPVPAGQPILIESIHLSPTLLDNIAIFINGQPLTREENSEVTPFPGGYINLLVHSENKLLRTGRFRPPWPIREEKLSLLWVGLVPGTYELRLEASRKPDDPQQDEPIPGNSIVQRIEVQDPAP
jgi:hypothetical protein